jgi:heat shock protein HtpX
LYKEIAANKRKSILFICFFIILITASVYVLTFYLGDSNALLFSIIALVITLLLSFGAFYNSDKIILKMSKAREVVKDEEPYLYNTIEGVAMAAGLPVPKMYIIEKNIPNAFATGRNPEKGIIAVTRGLLDVLNREELEGVIAHEMGHIKNYDILYASLVAVLAGMIIFLARFAFRFSLGGRRSRSKSSGGGSLGVIIMVIGLILFIVGPILAKILQFAMSRNREYLADATAAKILGYPLGLASALERLSIYNTKEAAKRDDFDNEATAALCIISPLQSKDIDNLFSTHPALEKRIKRLKEM